MYSNQKILWHGIRNNSNNISLHVTMFSSSDLFELGYAFLKVPKTGVWMEDREMEVDLARTKGTNAPLCIMIPKHFVPMMKQFWG